MTAIAALVHNQRVHIAGDSAGVGDHYALTVRADAKVFTNGPYVMGFTTSFRMGQLLRWSLKAPRPEHDLDRFMATTFIDGVRDCLRDGGWMSKDSEREQGGDFLVGIAGRLFCVYSDFQVAEAADGYAAVGCGYQIVLGSLHATARTDMKPKKRLKLALEAAERHNAGVRGPFAFQQIGDLG